VALLNRDDTRERPRVFPIDHAAVLRDQTERFARVLEAGPVDQPVPQCPGWDLAELTRHTGFVHRWAVIAIRTRAEPDRATVPGPPVGHQGTPVRGDELADWLRAGADELADSLVTLDPQEPTWHPFPVAQVAAVWPRRQVQETLVHRCDAEAAVGPLGPVDPLVAAEGIDEYLTMTLRRMRARERPDLRFPTDTLRVECSDTAHAWTVSCFDEELVVTVDPVRPSPDLPDTLGVARGRAADLLFTMWGRGYAEPLELSSATGVARAWLGIGGA
jgi:uncharacterized protein (TIGR03083 family)